MLIVLTWHIREPPMLLHEASFSVDSDPCKNGIHLIVCVCPCISVGGRKEMADYRSCLFPFSRERERRPVINLSFPLGMAH